MVLSYLAGLNVITMVLIRGGQEGQSQRRREVRRFYSAGFEDGGWVHELRSVGSLYKLEKAKKQILPKTFRRNAVLSTPLQLPFSLSGMSCPLSLTVLLLFVTVQMSPPLSPIPLENVIGCNYVVPKTFHIGTGTFCACVWLFHKVMNSSKGRDCILFIYVFSPAPCIWHLVHTEVQQCLSN